MRCSRFRKLIVIISDGEQSSHLQQQLDGHQRQCPACREYARRMARVRRLLLDLPAESAPETFAKQLRQRLAQVSRNQRGPWYRRLWGDLKPPAPLVQPVVAFVGVAAVVLLVSMGTLFLHSSSIPNVAPVRVGPSAPGTQITEIESISEPSIWEEVRLRHRRYVLNQPLADDPGLQLISYPLSTE